VLIPRWGHRWCGRAQEGRTAGIAPELLAQQGQGAQLLPVVGLPQNSWQHQLHRQLIATLGIVGNQRWYRAERKPRALQTQNIIVRLDEIMLDIGSRILGQSHRNSHRIRLAGTANYEGLKMRTENKE